MTGIIDHNVCGNLEAHLAKAVERHPGFCDAFAAQSHAWWTSELIDRRNEQNRERNARRETLETILRTEVAELMCELTSPNMNIQSAINEAFDVVAVCIRLVKRLEEERDNAKGEAK